MDDTGTVTAAVTAEIELGADADAAWEAVATPEGWAGWLADEVDLDEVRPGAAGRLTEDGIDRRVCVVDVDPGRHVRFTWWREDRPADASTVTLVVLPVAGAVRLRVVETTALAGLGAGLRAEATLLRCRA